MKVKASILFLLIIVNTVSFAQDVNGLIADGNDFYRKQQWVKAELQYRKALETSPANREAKYNLANSLLKQTRNAEAEKLLTELNNKETDPLFRSKVNYNTGVKLTNEKKLEESIEAYKQALRLDANDQEARENLQKALLELKKKQSSQQQQKQKKEEQKPKPKISPQQADQQLKKLEQKEKEVNQRFQKNKAGAGSQPKDW
jgi:Ca-activated chloride channel family protein